MGIVNVTPDSFSDGGKFATTNAAVKHALALVAQGAEILDIGGESTRPGAQPVSEKEELRRVIPVIEKLADIFRSGGRAALPRRRPADPQVSPTKLSVALSIDTLKPAVARAALAAGASIVNDVAANRSDDAMWKIVAEFQAGYICMHAQGSPQTMQKNPRYQNVVHEVEKFFRERLKKLNAAGLSTDQVVFDPGIGFGKTLEQNLQLLAALKNFGRLHRPLLLGVSRKSFIEKFCGAKLNERLPASLACATLAVTDGVQLIRTHDVAETVQAIRLTEAILCR